ncbi:MAG: DMT family transporter [Gammaproteobacteria bacterium]|nr:DMT family transporter [Gammaproteobacteria bacterium]
MSKNWAYLMLAGSALFWSGNFVIGRAFSTDIQPLTISYLRWSTALVVILPFTLKSLVSQWSIIRANLPLLIFMGVLGVACFNTFAYLGLNKTSATNALLINSFIPILIILLSRIKPGIPITAAKFIGILISTCGVLLLVSRGEINNLLAFKINRGDLWVLLAAFVWATYSISLRWRPAELTAPAFLSFTMIIGVIILSPLFWFNVLNEPPFVASTPNLAAIVYVALFASIGAFLFWNQGVKIVGAGTAGQFIHLMPVFGTIMAIVFLGEQLFWFHIAGAVAIGSGIYLSLRKAV